MVSCKGTPGFIPRFSTKHQRRLGRFFKKQLGFCCVVISFKIPFPARPFYRPQGRICHSKDRCPVRAMGVILKSSTPGASLWDGCYVFISHPTSRCSFELATPALFWHGCHIVHVVIVRSATIRLNVPLNPPCGSQLCKGSGKGACGLYFLWSFPLDNQTVV